MQDGEASAIATRKPARQRRSQARVRLILDTTLAMLNAGPADRITTNDIARNAGISIGSLYQFFPRKEAIYYELYRQWLEQTLELLDAVDARFDGSEDMDAYADAIFESLSAENGINTRGHWQLRFAMGSTPELEALQEQHNAKAFQRIIASQRKFSRTVTPEQAHALARLRHNVAVACLSAAADVTSQPERDILLTWCKKTLRLVYDIDKLNA